MLSLAFFSSVIIGLLGISLLVAVHELGHFMFAKLFNVYVPSFSIGFGPRLVEKKIGETTFALSAIPLGGYVEIAGSQELGQGEQLHASSKDERSFAAKPYWQKFLIMIGGILFNLIFAFLALSFLFNVGTPAIGPMTNNKPAIIGAVLPDSAAQKAGLQPHDKIIAVNDAAIVTIQDYVNSTKNKPNQTVNLTIERNGVEQKISTALGSQKVNNAEISKLGVHWHILALPFAQAIQKGFQETKNLAILTFKSLLPIFPKSGEEQGSIGGPIALIAQMIQAAGNGMKFFLLFLALVSIGLAVLNLFPLPILDGGQILFFTIEAITGKPIADATRYKIHQYSWYFILALIAFLSYRDITKLLGLDVYIDKLVGSIRGLFSK